MKKAGVSNFFWGILLWLACVAIDLIPLCLTVAIPLFGQNNIVSSKQVVAAYRSIVYSVDFLFVIIGGLLVLPIECLCSKFSNKFAEIGSKICSYLCYVVGIFSLIVYIFCRVFPSAGSYFNGHGVIYIKIMLCVTLVAAVLMNVLRSIE